MVPITSSPATKHDVITLGETMWRLSPPGEERIEQAHNLAIHIGGAESNVAVGLARLGKQVAWWSKLPENVLGRHVANGIRSQGVDISWVCWSEGRLGTYFVEFAPAPRPTQVIYDRAGSAASKMQPDDFNWEHIKQTRWLHLTGITPALSQSCLETVRRALQEANAAGVSISFDLNYRAKLWTPEQAKVVLDELAPQCTMVIAAKRDVETIFQIKGDRDDVLHQLGERWNNKIIVLTQGANGTSAFDGSDIYHAPAFDVPHPIRIGAGDAFDAGLLYSLLEGKTLADALIYGNAVAALKLTMPGDMALVTRQEVDAFLVNQTSTVVR